MARVLKATDYGHRIAITVVLNPQDPRYVHADGTAHPPENVDGCPHSRDPLTGLENQDVPGCRSNWQVVQYTWDGPDTFYTDAQGQRRRKTNSILKKELKARIAAEQPQTPRTLSLQGQEV